MAGFSLSGRGNIAAGRRLARIGAEPDWASARADLSRDRERWPHRPVAVIVTDDGIPYSQAISAIDLVKAAGYTSILLAGGPPAPAPLPRP
jgi:biopolymer transport protein ExbD